MKVDYVEYSQYTFTVSPNDELKGTGFGCGNSLSSQNYKSKVVHSFPKWQYFWNTIIYNSIFFLPAALVKLVLKLDVCLALEVIQPVNYLFAQLT